jgi:hypothetical protein
LLYPYASGVNLINNAIHVKDVNAVLKWSNHSFHQKSWLKKSPEELLAQSRTGLMLDLVATRDIFQGDEILIDYGPEWNEEWKIHFDQWTPVDNADQYTPSYVMNDAIDLLRTQEEEKKFYPYPDNLHTACFFKYQNGSSVISH